MSRQLKDFISRELRHACSQLFNTKRVKKNNGYNLWHFGASSCAGCGRKEQAGTLGAARPALLV
jgi:hypothetical protein